MIIFGGNDGSTAFDDAWALDLVALRWSEIRVRGARPPARSGHSSVAYASRAAAAATDAAPISDAPTDRMLVFGGGRGFGEHTHADLWELDLGAREPVWRRPVCRGRPPIARTGHSAVVTGSRMLVFGGGQSTRAFNDVHALDLRTLRWESAMDVGGVPEPRAGHAAVAVGSLMVVFGGATPDGVALNDLHCLDTSFAPELIESPAPPADIATDVPPAESRRRRGRAAVAAASSAVNPPLADEEEDDGDEEEPTTAAAAGALSTAGSMMVVAGDRVEECGSAVSAGAAAAASDDRASIHTDETAQTLTDAGPTRRSNADRTAVGRLRAPSEPLASDSSRRLMRRTVGGTRIPSAEPLARALDEVQGRTRGWSRGSRGELALAASATAAAAAAGVSSDESETLVRAAPLGASGAQAAPSDGGEDMTAEVSLLPNRRASAPVLPRRSAARQSEDRVTELVTSSAHTSTGVRAALAALRESCESQWAALAAQVTESRRVALEAIDRLEAAMARADGEHVDVESER